MKLYSLLKKRKLFNTAAILSVAGGVTAGTTIPDISVESVRYIADVAQYPGLELQEYGIQSNDKLTSILETVSPMDYVFKPSKCFHNKLEQEAYELFGNLRELDQEERVARKQTMDKISKNTGVSFFDI